jgi:hypothetical protein
VDSNDITVLVSGEQNHYFHLWGLQKPLVAFVTRDFFRPHSWKQWPVQCRCQLTRWRGYNCKHKFGLRGNLREMDALGFHSRWSQSQIRWLEVLFQSQMTNSDDGKNKFRRSRDPGPKGKKIHGHELTEKSQTCCVRWIFIYNMVWICGGISIHPYMSHYINICRGISMSLNYYSRSL